MDKSLDYFTDERSQIGKGNIFNAIHTKFLKGQANRDRNYVGSWLE